MASAFSFSSVTTYSASTSYPHYDVFISHRGPDVKSTFAAHLYRRLLDHGLQVFLDKPELLEGRPIPPQIHAAIEVASVHIAIFSPGYADSKWCLAELVLMLESKATILPVFYKVEPYELRWTAKDGAYAEALRRHEQKKTFDSQTGEEKPRYDSNTIPSWRRALSEAAEISGFRLEGDEEELLNTVVQGVLKNVSKPLLYVAKYPTGVEDKLQDFEMTVLKEQEQPVNAKVVGIVGCGGVGKTTLAKAFFNRKRSAYNESSFLFDVREKSERMSVNYLQAKLIEDLKRRNIKIESPDEGIEILKQNLSSCQALIIVDDVDNAYQLEMLLPMRDFLSPESLILVTTRDKHVLKSSGVLESSIYHLTGLDMPHSQELFCSSAFFQRLPPPEFGELVDRFVTACGGLPLSLKVIGALLCGQNALYWEEQFDRLSQTLPDEIQKRLRLSYDSLSREDQEIFLDIACFFLGEKRDKATRIWGLVGLQNLENKCLLEVSSQSKIRMHDHVRDCARNIATEGSITRRLWNATTDIIDDLLVQMSCARTQVRGLSVRDVYTNSEMVLINSFPYRNMRNLQLVASHEDGLERILKRVQSPHLIWLRWYGCSCFSLPDWIPMESLRVLEVQGSRLNFLWPQQSQGPIQLRELNLEAPLSEFPKSIGQLGHLEWIAINDRRLFVSTVEALPQEFGHLRSLKYLMLKEFSRMMSLPDSFGKLSNLQHIDLEGASSLQMLPKSFGDLNRLKHLSLARCSSLTISTGTLGNITTLEYLNLQCCSNVKELPPQIAHQPSLKTLYMECTCLKELPCGIGNLCNLELLHIGNDSLEVLPPSVCYLKSLKDLSVRHSPKLKCLPDSIGLLTQLTKLMLEGCGIEYLPRGLLKLNNLRGVTVRNCPLQELPFRTVDGEAGGRRSWNKLDCAKDKCMLGLWRLSLKGTKISEVAFAEGVCPNLELLYINGCEELRQIRGLCGLSKLVIIRIKSCVKLEDLESLETLRSLREVRVRGCRKLKIIQGLAQLRKLQILEVSGSDDIVELPGVEHCRSLEYLDVRGCPKLMNIEGLVQLTELQWLKASGCHEIVGLPGVEHCMKLRSLDARDCPKLQWGGGVLQELRHRLEGGLCIDVKP